MIQDHRLNPHQAVVPDRAAVQHGLVAYGNVAAQHERCARVHVQHSIFLHG